MNEKDYELYILDITNDDLEVEERWLVKVSWNENEVIEKDGIILIRRDLIFEIVDRYAPSVNIALEMGYEIAKLPYIISRNGIDRLGRSGRMLIHDTVFRSVLKKRRMQYERLD